MTVADLIRELRAMPQGSQVRVVPSSVYIAIEVGVDEIVPFDDDEHAARAHPCTKL